MTGHSHRFRTRRSIRVQILAIAWLPSLALLLVGLLVAGALAVQGWGTRSDVDRLTQVTAPTTSLFTAFDAERRLSMLYVADPASSPAALQHVRPATDAALAAFTKLMSTNSQAAQLAPTFSSLPDRLATLRQQIDGREAGVVDVWQFFLPINNAFVEALERTSAQQPDAKAAAERMSGALLTRAADSLFGVDTLARVDAAGTGLTTPEFSLFSQALGAMQARFDEVEPLLPAVQKSGLDRVLASADYGRLLRLYNQLVSAGPEPQRTIPAVTPAMDVQTWEAAFERTETQLNDLVLGQVAYATGVSRDEADGQIRRALVVGGLLLLLAVVVLLASTMASSRLVRRLRRLQSETIALARERLPEIVGRLRLGLPVDVAREMPPLEFGTDEIGQVASAFEEAQRAATTAAVREAETRAGFRTVFLDIARRGQAIVHRQLAVLDQAERTQQDPDLLAMLFQLDHLSTRARRNAENLVVLGGGQAGRQWRQPVPLIDVARSAISESEDYVRVFVTPLPEVTVKGAAVADLIHLLAELVDNATTFSPPETGVELRGIVVGRGVALELEDRGLGFEPGELEHYNQMLRQPPNFDVMALADEPRLGLFVVAQLAARHEITVTLTASAAYGGTCVVVLLPASILANGSAPQSPAGAAISSNGAPELTRDGKHRSDLSGPLVPRPAGPAITQLSGSAAESSLLSIVGPGFTPGGQPSAELVAGPRLEPTAGPEPAGPPPGDDRRGLPSNWHASGPFDRPPPPGEVSLFQAPVRPYQPQSESDPGNDSPDKEAAWADPPGAAAVREPHRAAPSPDLDAAPAPEPGNRPELPLRHRQGHLSPLLRDVPAPVADAATGVGPTAEPDPDQVRRRMAALQRGTIRGRSAELEN